MRIIIISYLKPYVYMAQLAGVVEYTDCISVEAKTSLMSVLDYDTKQSDGEAPGILELWGNAEYRFIVIDPKFSLAGRGSTW